MAPESHGFRPGGGGGEIDIHEAAALLAKGGAVFVDIRDPGSYASAHIPGAVQATRERIDALLASADLGAPVVVYCYHGNSSRSAAQWFRQQGFSEARSLQGGFETWEAAARSDGAFAIATERG